MTTPDATDPRLPIIARFARQMGIPTEVFTGTADGKPPAIEVDLNPSGERHQLIWRGGTGGTIAGMVTVYSDGRIETHGQPRQQWRPSIGTADATLAACVNGAAAELNGEIADRLSRPTAEEPTR